MSQDIELDYLSIDEMDPSIIDGYRIIYDREVPLEIRSLFDGDLDPSQNPGSIESIKVKLMILGSDDCPSSIKLELSSESDLFFHFIHFIDADGYMIIQDAQKLMVEFTDYPNILIRMLNLCIREPQSHLGIFLMLKGKEARLDFIQNMEYKFVELMSCQFVNSPDETIQTHITYRYNSMKQKLVTMQSRLHDINNLVKTKNPSLLLQLGKNGFQNGSNLGYSNNTSIPNSSSSINNNNVFNSGNLSVRSDQRSINGR